MQLGEGLAVASFPSIEAMEEKYVAGGPLIVVFGPSYAEPAGLKAVQGLTRYRPEVGALMVVEELSTAMLQQALRAGVRDVISLPADQDFLLEAIDRVADTISVVPMAPAGTPATALPSAMGS